MYVYVGVYECVKMQMFAYKHAHATSCQINAKPQWVREWMERKVRKQPREEKVLKEHTKRQYWVEEEVIRGDK